MRAGKNSNTQGLTNGRRSARHSVSRHQTQIAAARPVCSMAGCLFSGGTSSHTTP